MKGYITNLPEGKFFGFIKVAEKEYFFHRSDFYGHWDELRNDWAKSKMKIEVEFDSVDSDRGPRAANVKRLDWPNEG